MALPLLLPRLAVLWTTTVLCATTDATLQLETSSQPRELPLVDHAWARSTRSHATPDAGCDQPSCGDVCSFEPAPASTYNGSALTVPAVAKEWSCARVMERMMTSCPAKQWPPPRILPSDVLDEFLMHADPSRPTPHARKPKRVHFQHAAKFRYTRYSGRKSMVPTWTEAYIDELRAHPHNISVYGTLVDGERGFGNW